MVLAGVVVVVQSVSSVSLAPPVVSEPNGSLTTLVVTMVFGAIGGLMSALVALYVRESPLDDVQWFDPRPGLTLAKLSFGVWSAVIGVLTVSGALVAGGFTSLAAVALLALLFGYGQQAVTAALDRQAAALLERVDKQHGAGGTVLGIPMS